MYPVIMVPSADSILYLWAPCVYSHPVFVGLLMLIESYIQGHPVVILSCAHGTPCSHGVTYVNGAPCAHGCPLLMGHPILMRHPMFMGTLFSWAPCVHGASCAPGVW